MYSFEWDKRTGRYRLTSQSGKFVASEIRPVFAEELIVTGLNEQLTFDPQERRPFLWAKRNTFLYRGEEIAKVNKVLYGKPLSVEWKGIFAEANEESVTTRPFRKKKISPVNIESLVSENRPIMSALVSDTLKRIKEMYDAYIGKCDVAYIGFSGGKDSIVLLDLCHKVLPLDVPVVFSDTDMELPDTYNVWEEVQKCYPGRPFLKVASKKSALENWKLFGPPSQALRWCCSVHKSAPAILALKERLGKKSIKTLAFVGVRGEESLRRSSYDDIGEGSKSQSQVNAMPILAWSAHELWLYIFEHDLVLNEAYRKGLQRVGCLVCPMSTGRQNELIRTNYGEAVEPFLNIVRETIGRDFSSKTDEDDFVYGGGWHARKSGVSLKQVINEPGIERKKDRLSCEYPIDAEPSLKEWLKAVGDIKHAEISFFSDNKRDWLQCVWKTGKVDRTIVKWIVYAVHKAIACVGCGACEAECPTGALQLKRNSYTGQLTVSIDKESCIHCMKCYVPNDGCWRYYSKRYAGATSMNISGINKYMTFGLNPQWIEVLANEGVDFRHTTALGNRMIPSAVTWFREAGLIENSTAICPTRLLELGKSRNFSDLMLWQLLWMRLANFSPLVKWYVCNTELDVEYSRESIDDKLAEFVSSVSVRKGALGSLCKLVKDSPLSDLDSTLVEVGLKGRSVVQLTRCSHKVDPLVVLYGLYVMAEKCDRETFTIRQMMVAEFDGATVSPMALFGISPDEFKKQCMGLTAVYPDFIGCSFTLGLDEVRVFSKNKNRNNVIDLILAR